VAEGVPVRSVADVVNELAKHDHPDVCKEQLNRLLAVFDSHGRHAEVMVVPTVYPKSIRKGECVADCELSQLDANISMNDEGGMTMSINLRSVSDVIDLVDRLRQIREPE